METCFTAYIVSYASPETPGQTRAFLKPLDAIKCLAFLAENCDFLVMDTEQVNGTFNPNASHGIYCVECVSDGYCRSEYFATMALACRWVLDVAGAFGWTVNSITEIYLVDGE